MHPLLYPQGKSPWYPLDRRPGGPQSWSGCGGEEKNLFQNYYFIKTYNINEVRYIGLQCSGDKNKMRLL
jgi:hypothetical protein